MVCDFDLACFDGGEGGMFWVKRCLHLLLGRGYSGRFIA
jgi:hypothetical protein